MKFQLTVDFQEEAECTRSGVWKTQCVRFSEKKIFISKNCRFAGEVRGCGIVIFVGSQNESQYLQALTSNSIPQNLQQSPINTAIYCLCPRHKHDKTAQKVLLISVSTSVILKSKVSSTKELLPLAVPSVYSAGRLQVISLDGRAQQYKRHTAICTADTHTHTYTHPQLHKRHTEICNADTHTSNSNPDTAEKVHCSTVQVQYL
jgi:hypothetical protein